MDQEREDLDYSRKWEEDKNRKALTRKKPADRGRAQQQPEKSGETKEWEKQKKKKPLD